MVQEGGCPDFQTAVHLLTATCFTLAAYAAWLYLTLATIGSHEPAYWDRALVCVGGGLGVICFLVVTFFSPALQGVSFCTGSFLPCYPAQANALWTCSISLYRVPKMHPSAAFPRSCSPHIPALPPPSHIAFSAPLPLSPCHESFQSSGQGTPPPHSQGSREGALVVGSLGAKAMARPRLHPVPGADQAELSGPPRAGVPGTPGPTPPP